eukprot:776713-Prymnesium_polylepis.2
MDVDHRIAGMGRRKDSSIRCESVRPGVDGGRAPAVRRGAGRSPGGAVRCTWSKAVSENRKLRDGRTN